MLKLPGVGDKIANCVLLFAYGFPTAFPVDVWMLKVLRQFYFRRRRELSPCHRFHETAEKTFSVPMQDARSEPISISLDTDPERFFPFRAVDR